MAKTGGSAGAGASGGGAGTGGGEGSEITREVPGFADRSYHLHSPGSSPSTSPTPLVIVFHGGGGNAESSNKITCPGGDETSPGCLSHVAARRGFAVAYANGVPTPVLPNVRTWNAGGGVDDWQCVSGYSCTQGRDDVAYFDALLADVSLAMNVDAKRVYLTGISNGAAMCHRLACERAGVLAAIAPVAGENQLQTSATCAPSRPVSIFDLHGTADPCWAYEGGPAACAQADGKNKLDVATSVGAWVARLGCSATPATADLPDTASDGCLGHLARYTGCAAGSEVHLLRIEGGGHTWPGGSQYSATVGPVCSDFDADELMLDFFAAHPAP